MLTGAKAALQGTPGISCIEILIYPLDLVWSLGMIGYGLAKAAVHQLVQSLSDPASGLPPEAGVVGILP